MITGPIIAEIAALVAEPARATSSSRFNRVFRIPSRGFWNP